MIAVNIPSNLKLTISETEFDRLAIANRDLRLERKQNGEIIIMPPTGGETGNKNLKILLQLGNWNEQRQTGLVFDSSTGFRLPSSAIRSPDASWVSNDKWNSLTPERKKQFPPICPEFIVELRSPTDNLKTLQNKMSEYLANGLILGWLIDPINKKVEIYRAGKNKETLDRPTILSGENVLPGFSLDLNKVW